MEIFYKVQDKLDNNTLLDITSSKHIFHAKYMIRSFVTSNIIDNSSVCNYRVTYK